MVSIFSKIAKLTTAEPSKEALSDTSAQDLFDALRDKLAFYGKLAQMDSDSALESVTANRGDRLWSEREGYQISDNPSVKAGGAAGSYANGAASGAAGSYANGAASGAAAGSKANDKASVSVIVKNDDGSYTRYLDGKGYTVTPKDSLGRYDKIAAEYLAQLSGGLGDYTGAYEGLPPTLPAKNGAVGNPYAGGSSYVGGAYTGAYGNMSSDSSQAQAALQRQLQSYLTQINKQAQSAGGYLDPAVFKQNTLSLQEAYDLAYDLVAPAYRNAYGAAATAAAQKLDKMGLYDSLYGQALAAQAQNSVTDQLQQAAIALAQQLQQADRDEALALYKSAVSQSQAAAKRQDDLLTSGLSYVYKALQDLVKQAADSRDYALAYQAQLLKEQVAAAQISEAEAKLRLEALKLSLK